MSLMNFIQLWPESAAHNNAGVPANARDMADEAPQY